MYIIIDVAGTDSPKGEGNLPSGVLSNMASARGSLKSRRRAANGGNHTPPRIDGNGQAPRKAGSAPRRSWPRLSDFFMILSDFIIFLSYFIILLLCSISQMQRDSFV